MKNLLILLLLLPLYLHGQLFTSGMMDTRVTHQEITNGVMLGDSFMAGSLASPSSNSYRSLFIDFYTLTEQNQSLGGAGVWREVKNINATVFTQGVTFTLISAGLNDIRRSHSTETFNKIESSLKTVIKRALGSSSAVASGSSSVTRVGSFTAFDAATYGGFYTTGTLPCSNCACFSQTVNNTWTWSFTGTNVFVTFSASDPSISRGDAEVRIDGNLVETITDLESRYDAVSDGVYDNKRGPDTRFYFGLSSGSHSIEVKVTSAAPVVIDQFGVLQSPRTAGKVLVLQVPYVLDYNKTGLNQGSDAYIDDVNDLRRGIVNYFKGLGYEVHYVKIQPPYVMDLGVTIDATDSVHPLNAGHAQIFTGLRKAIK